MAWQDQLKGEALAWLLEEDTNHPGVRYWALRDLMDRAAEDVEVVAARAAVMASGPVPAILNAQQADGYWLGPGKSYGKYQGAYWQIMFLAEMGADPNDARVRRGCDYVLDTGRATTGGFDTSSHPTPGGVLHCLNGNVLTALITLGYADDERVQAALDWQARAITGEGDFEYFRSRTSGPDFACGINHGLGCGWGAVKAMKGLAALPVEKRTPEIERAMAMGVDFLLRYDLRTAAYPTLEGVSERWFKLGYPLSYWSDILETLTVLAALGYGADARLQPAYDWVLGQQDAQGRWKLGDTVPNKVWFKREARGKPSKWVTLRALRLVKLMEG